MFNFLASLIEIRVMMVRSRKKLLYASARAATTTAELSSSLLLLFHQIISHSDFFNSFCYTPRYSISRHITKRKGVVINGSWFVYIIV
jgi:hypothetical protein